MESSRKDECMIAIIDYDAGNLRSVEKALLALRSEERRVGKECM